TTARRRAEEALRVAHDRLRVHVTSTPLAVIEWDAAYRVRSVSARAEQLFGYAAEEMLGKSYLELPWVHPEDWPAVRDVARDMTAGRPSTMSANRNVRKDGSIRYCEWYNSSILD